MHPTQTLPPPADSRVFVLLQGPHGPFFGQLGKMLRLAGAKVWRIGFNAGDARFWPDHDSYVPYTKTPADWDADAPEILDKLNATDIVLYGDVRPVHASAIIAARAMGLRVHVFEEGYLRPSWVTYERDGANGNSALMSLSIPQMQAALNAYAPELSAAPSRWGEMRHHIWHGARYQFHVMMRNRAYAGFTPHRSLNVRQEFALYLRKLVGLPMVAARRALATRRIRRGGFPYHLFLLQLEHDSSFQAHSDHTSFADVLDEVFAAFAHGAPPHHHLVLKAHPLEDNRADLRRTVSSLASCHGITDRIHFVAGGKLAPLLDPARSTLTVNSTAAQQALWRGLPVKALGRAIYAKPELVSDQPLAAFFARPMPPDMRAYRDFRHFLLESSQVTGGFYSRRGRQSLLRQVVDLMMEESDPYAALLSGHPRRKHPIRIVAK